MQVALGYDHRSSAVTALDATAVDFATNVRRPPVAFCGQVKDPVLLRQLLGALHQVILGDFRWLGHDDWVLTLDPVITVHPDQLFFEAFSNDQSCYARLSAPRQAFVEEGAVQHGTTNIDFTWQLREALAMLRSSRRTTFTVGAAGFGVATAGGRAHFERKVEVPEAWVRGFLQVQAALAVRPFVFDIRPVDLLSAIAYFQDNRPPRPPHGLRFELRPGEPIRLVLEPWDEAFVLKGTTYQGYERKIRLWGRRRLELLLHVLPYAQRVTVVLLGRALPHFYVCHCSGYQFVLGLSGWTRNDWSQGSAFDLLAPRSELGPELVQAVYEALARRLIAERDDLVADVNQLPREVEHALFQLCRAGRAMFDPTTRRYRLRELFAEPLDLGALFTPDPRWAAGERLHDEGKVTVRTVAAPDEDASGRMETRATALVEDANAYEVAVSLDVDGRLRFGRCGCPYFQQNMMARGPCPHILAAWLAVERQTRGTRRIDTIDDREA